ncbi:MAG TPA: isochorismatase family protein [Syntrophorhabdaceae bacterium]|nr:isochorismatase family protein [Syntrophorhabdaceae bacterium]HQM81766.1 isochorismatase family protein [Syntrophorhabdaceae bacterium]
MREKTAAIVTDIQGDFTTAKNGVLAAPGTDEAYLAKVSSATADLKRHGVTIYATQDWHPANHISFAVNHPGRMPFETIEIDGRTQVLWPPHCIQGTKGAEIITDNGLFEKIVRKGQDPRFDSYSGFQDDGGIETEMNSLLKAGGFTKVIVYGIATDYCVRATSIDAHIRGYTVIVIEDLSKGITPDTTASALKEMRERGIFVR